MIQIEFISSLLEQPAPTLAVETGVTRDWFDADSSKVYQFVLDYWKKYRTMPTLGAVKRQCPTFTPLKTKEPFAYHLDQLRQSVQRRILNEAVAAVTTIDGTDKPLEVATSELHRKVSEVVRIGAHTSDHDWSSDKEARGRWEDYLQVSKLGGMRGIPTPWNELNAEMLGIQNKHLIVIAGRPGVGKTWSGVILTHHAVSRCHKKCLVISKEMTEMELGRRYDSLELKISAKLLRRGKLPKADEKRYKEYLIAKRQQQKGRLVIVTDDSVGEKTGTMLIRAKLEMWQPDILFVDGAYLLRNRPDANKTADQYDVSQDLKRIAREFNIPVIATIQMGRPKNEKESRQGGSLAGFAWADAWGQDADEGFEVFQTPSMKIEHMMMLTMLKQREGELIKLTLNWDFEKVDFSVAASSSGEDMVASDREVLDV